MKKGIIISTILILIITLISGINALICGDSVVSNTIMNGNISGCLWGVSIESDNITFDCNGYSVNGYSWTGIGIYSLNNRNNIIIKNCNIHGFSQGIRFEDGSNITLINDTLYNNTDGCIMKGSNNTFINNTFYDNYYSGLHIEGTDNLITNNQFWYNTYGLYFYGGFNNLISGNNLSYNNIGIYLLLTGSNIIINNNIRNNSNLNLYQDSYPWYPEINATKNWWGITNKTEIEKNIDAKVNYSYIPFFCESYPTNWISDLNGNCINLCKDSDNDGVCDDKDLCPKTNQGDEVDKDGCSQMQFCLKQPICGYFCDMADWKNNEPGKNPYDCTTVIVEKEGDYYPRCAALVGNKCGN